MKVKKKVTKKGKNVRFTDDAYEVLKSFCSSRGYKLGKFCELGAISKMNNENNLN